MRERELARVTVKEEDARSFPVSRVIADEIGGLTRGRLRRRRRGFFPENGRRIPMIDVEYGQRKVSAPRYRSLPLFPFSFFSSLSRKMR